MCERDAPASNIVLCAHSKISTVQASFLYIFYEPDDDLRALAGPIDRKINSDKERGKLIIPIFQSIYSIR